MKVIRASKTTLKFATKSKRRELNVIMDEYSRVTNLFIGQFWTQNLVRSGLTKEITNQPDSWLSARMRQCAAREALGMVDGTRVSAKAKNIEPVKPVHTGQKMTLSAQCVRVEEGDNSFDLWMTLYSIGKLNGHSIKLLIPLKKHYHMNKFESWTRSSTVVIHREYVQFSFETTVSPKVESGRLVGIDVGINHLMATTEGELIGTEVKRLINNIKRKVQGSKGYRRAKRTLSYYLHKVVKDFFQANSDLRLIVVERLHNLKQGKGKRHKSFRKTLSNWNYRELLNIIEMRCEENRVSFRSVNPYKTSQRCPHCSHTERGNRSNEKFFCLRCGYTSNADLVGALNILDRFTSGRYGAAFKT